MKTWIHKYFSEDQLALIQKEISKVEQTTSGEIRLSIRKKRSFKERKRELHDIALAEFHHLAMQNTKDKTGILIFILFGERYFDIIADEGIHKKIPDNAWIEMEEKLKEEFRAGNYAGAVLHVVDKAGEVLQQEFPRQADDTNELSDEIKVR